MSVPASPSVDEIALADPAFWLRPDRDAAFAALRRERPVSWHDEPVTDWNPSGGRGFWAVTRFDDVRDLSRDSRRFISGLGTEIPDLSPEAVRTFGAMLNMDDPEHRRLRSIVSLPFTPKYLEQMRERSRDHARRLVADAAERERVDLMDVVGVYPAQVICDLMGVPQELRPEAIRLTGVALGSTYGIGDSFEAMLELIEMTSALARARRHDPQDDLLSKIAHAEIDGDRLSDTEVGEFAALLLTAGIETTGTALAGGFIALQQHPDQRARWMADFHGVAPTAIEEIVRWVTPVICFRRTAAEDVEVAGQTVARGDKVVLWYCSANRDETVFEEPDRFDVTRPANRHVSFGGGGAHFCLGANLARMEMTVMFEELFRELPNAELDGEPQYLHSNFVNGVVSLPVRTNRSSA